MIRVKIPRASSTPSSSKRCADIADEYSRGFGHVTTRQNVQLHFVELGGRRRRCAGSTRSASPPARRAATPCAT